MKLLVDCRYVRIGAHDGISRFTAGIVTELAKLLPLTMLISDERQLELLPALPWVRGSAPTSLGEPLLARRINALHPDVVFSPMQTMGSRGRKYRLILTVHDLIYYAHPTPPRDLPWLVRVLWRLYHRAWWPQRMLLNGADAVATVSETTRGLIAQHSLTRRPVLLVPNAADPLPLPVLAERTPPKQFRIVYMGSFMPYKNVDTLVRAMELLPDAELELLSRVSDAEQGRLRSIAPNARLVFRNGVSDAEYADALDHATALVSASLDEGFGIPLVEAGSRGTPIVVSDIPIFREIGADAARYCDPHSAESIAEQLAALRDPAEWLRHSAAARENAARYSWAASAAALATAITELAGQDE